MSARLGGQRKTRTRALFARSSQCGLQLLLLLPPPHLLILSSLFDRRAFGFDGACLGLMLLPGFIESRLSLRDSLFTALELALPGGFLPQAFGLKPLLLALELQGGLSGGTLADLGRPALFAFK